MIGAVRAPDAGPGPDAFAMWTTFDRTAQPAGETLDPRIAFMLGEIWRHCKVLSAVGDAGAQVLTAVGVVADAVGVVVNADPQGTVEGITDLLAHHRVWERSPPEPA